MEEQKKYYWVNYLKTANTENGLVVENEAKVADVHAFYFKSNYSVTTDGITYWNYTLLSWKEITKEEFELFKTIQNRTNNQTN